MSQSPAPTSTVPEAAFEKLPATSKTSNTTYRYYVYPKGQKKFDRVLVYIHGLISDLNWFEVPKNLPENTGILYLPRHDRTHVEHFEDWTENYQTCFEDFKKTHESQHYHLLAQCFGTQPAMHWAVTKPDNFTSLTLACPPVETRDNYKLLDVLSILFGKKDGPQKALLTPRTYGRLPELIRFIENNPTTTYDFTHGFFKQTALLRSWIKKNLITYPAPTHCIFASDDGVVKHEAMKPLKNLKELPDKTTFFYGDHFLEMLPQRDAFWKEVFDFQRAHEVTYELSDPIKTVGFTGASGFLATHILRHLHENGRHIVIFDRNLDRSRKRFANITDRIEHRQADLGNLESLEKAVEGVDTLVHVAGFVSEWAPYEKFHEVNVEGTKNVLMAAHAKGVKQFIHISSLGVFGDTDQDHLDENNPYVISTDNYSNSKIHAEIFVKKYCRQNKIPFGIIRPGFIYGEGDNNFFPNLIDKLKTGKFKFIGSKENIVNTVYAGNICALVHAMTGNPESFGESYNISDPTDTTVSDFAWKVADKVGARRPEKVIAKGVALGLAVVLEALYHAFHIKTAPPISRKKLTFVGRSRSVNARKAYQLIGKEPFSYEEGMKRTLEALKV